MFGWSSDPLGGLPSCFRQIHIYSRQCGVPGKSEKSLFFPTLFLYFFVLSAS